MPEIIYTIGHSTHPLEHFLGLLRQHGIGAVCDVRSHPYSRRNPQFNLESLKLSLRGVDITYVFLGRELGARSQDPACYLDGKVQYDRLVQTDLFRSGLERLIEGMKRYRVALMCAEKDPLNCHRTLLVSRQLEAMKIRARHILADGTLEDNRAVLLRLRKKLQLPESDLFRSQEEMVQDACRMQGERIAYQSEDAAGSAE